ncbi:MAG: ribosomal RNA small subunit methyltransferase A [Pirellulaceae bacterium]|nr:ribosomal RNA small subunit methyltransferase A [Pirellulaceae bacterium]
MRPQTRYGQNFLIDLNLVRLIADSAELTKRDVVLEVGTGMGSLTTIMAAQAGHVVSVEIDHHLALLARSELEELENVTLLEQDALKSKNQLHPQVIQEIRQQVSQIPGGRLKLVANLPYNVATPILSNLLSIEPWPARMVATIQRELAERICATPRTKDYSALSVWMQAQCRTSIVRIMPPTVFWPQPKVESAIVDIQPQKVLRDRLAHREHFHDLVRKIFQHRRKFLRSALTVAVRDRLDKQQVDEIMSEMGLDATVRAEQLTPQQLIELSDSVWKSQTDCS